MTTGPLINEAPAERGRIGLISIKQHCEWLHAPRVRLAARVLIPMAAAALALWAEPFYARIAQDRPGVLPVTMVTLVAGLLVPPVRRGLIAALCYGIGLLAWRDISSLAPIPSDADSLLRPLYPAVWTLLACFAFAAGAIESLRPGTVIARRFYFGAAFLYFTGHGVIGFLRNSQWQPIVLTATGIVALVGVFVAPRIVAAEREGEDEPDIRALQRERETRAERVASGEWRESRDSEGQLSSSR